MFSASRVYKEFARFLTCLPNLHTLHILYVPPQYEDQFEQAFSRSGASYPTVRTAVLHALARHMLPYLPGILSLQFVGDFVTTGCEEAVRDIVNNANPELQVLNLGKPFFLPFAYIHKIGEQFLLLKMCHTDTVRLFQIYEAS